jgi:hypothetical protein
MNAKTRAPQPSRSSSGRDVSTGGAVYVEFLLSFIPLFFLFLGMVQMGLLYGADLAVRHAAVVAARAAMVVIDDDPERYDSDPRRNFEGDGLARETIIRSMVEAIFGSPSGGSSPPAVDSERYSAIHSAAGMVLLPFSPPANMIWTSPSDENVLRAIGTVPESRALFGVLYNEAGLVVTFPDEPISREFTREWDAPDESGISGPVTARVTYLFYCGVPLVNRLMCEDLAALLYGVDVSAIASLGAALASGSITPEEFYARLDDMRAHRDRLDRWRDRTDELAGAGGEIGVDLLGAMAAVSSVFGGPSPRFVPIQREATMPLQAANYCYRSEGSGDGCWEQELE